MAKIVVSAPHGPYQAKIDTQVMDVEIQEAYNGVKFTTLDGTAIVISQRDGGFELMYNTTPPLIHKGVIR